MSTTVNNEPAVAYSTAIRKSRGLIEQRTPENAATVKLLSSCMSTKDIAKLNQVNAKMTAIAGAMDSTMGRAGRMMPWVPFSP